METIKESVAEKYNATEQHPKKSFDQSKKAIIDKVQGGDAIKLMQ
jgi:hypothetical protein